MSERIVVTLNEANFKAKALDYAGLVMVTFWADWSGPCHIMTPVVQLVATALAERVQAARVDIDRQPRLARRYDIHLVPTLLFFVQGQVVDHIQGVISTQDLTAKLHAILDTIDT